MLFVFRTHIPEKFTTPPLTLRGLDPQTVYAVDGYGEPRSGLAWMQAGLYVPLHDLQSKLIRITAMD